MYASKMGATVRSTHADTNICQPLPRDGHTPIFGPPERWEES